MIKPLKGAQLLQGLLMASALLLPLKSGADDETLIDSSGHPNPTTPTAPEHPFAPLKEKPNPKKAASSKSSTHKASVKNKRTPSKKHSSKKPKKKKESQ